MPETEKYQEHVAAMDALDDDMRFEYIIDLAKAPDRPEFPSDAQVDENLMHGCMSKVWIVHDERDGRHYFKGHSDAVIVEGLVAMMTDSFSGLTTDELREVSLDDVRRLNLGALTTQRQVGMMAMLKHMQKLGGARGASAAA